MSAIMPKASAIPTFLRYFPTGEYAADTLCPNEHGIYAHATDQHFIQDAEIVRVNMDPSRFTRSILGLPYGYDSGRAVLKQVGWRGCTAACTAMLALDNFRKPDVYDVNISNIGSPETICFALNKAGLSTRVSRLATDGVERFTEQLEKKLHELGSGIIDVGGELGGHVVIVDEVTHENGKTLVDIRDPFHGWSITVGAEALHSRVDSTSKLIQVKGPYGPIVYPNGNSLNDLMKLYASGFD